VHCVCGLGGNVLTAKVAKDGREGCEENLLAEVLWDESCGSIFRSMCRKHFGVEVAEGQCTGAHAGVKWRSLAKWLKNSGLGIGGQLRRCASGTLLGCVMGGGISGGAGRKQIPHA